ncbi:hypothetical protein PTKIN_Ptkin05aG0103600 [Pterospermum kingtungense]
MKLVWRNTSNGELSFKSACMSARGLLGKGIPDRNQRDPMWKVVWMAKVIPRIKLFIWRAVRGILPTGDNLQSRQMEVVKEFAAHRIMVETDCLVAVQEIQKGLGSYSQWSCVVKDVVDLMAGLDDCSLSHDKRLGNRVADAVARTSFLTGSHML